MSYFPNSFQRCLIYQNNLALHENQDNIVNILPETSESNFFFKFWSYSLKCTSEIHIKCRNFPKQSIFPILFFYIFKEVFVDTYTKVCIIIPIQNKCLNSYAAAHSCILFRIFFQKTATAVLLQLN